MTLLKSVYRMYGDKEMYVFAKLFLKNNVVSLSYRTLYFCDERINKRRIKIIIRLSQMQIFER